MQLRVSLLAAVLFCGAAVVAPPSGWASHGDAGFALELPKYGPALTATKSYVILDAKRGGAAPVPQPTASEKPHRSTSKAVLLGLLVLVAVLLVVLVLLLLRVRRARRARKAPVAGEQAAPEQAIVARPVAGQAEPGWAGLL